MQMRGMRDGGGGHWLVRKEWRAAFRCTIVLFWHRLTEGVPEKEL